MQIPQNFLSYEHKTLILVCDSSHAKFYQAYERNFELIEEIKNDRMKLEDTERYTTQTGGGILSKVEDEDFKERETKIFYKKLAGILFDRFHDEKNSKLILVVPEGDKNVLVDSLHEKVKKSLVHAIGKQPPKIPDAQLIKFIDEGRKNPQ
ncbi:host attachment protein [Candidatus Uhrbacteria bacterium]|nr:host attachment protein [Candidatus Uhrbacteria bacterium]